MIDKRLTVSKRRIYYINSDTKTLETSVAFFEKRLKMLANIELFEFSSFDYMKERGPCDLLIINAGNLSDEAFIQWFPKISSKILQQMTVIVPCLFFSRIDFQSLDKLWDFSYKNNWYFDVIHPQHMDSLPIRVANLLRMHDHLHETIRYENELEKLTKRLSTLETKLEKLGPHEST